MTNIPDKWDLSTVGENWYNTKSDINDLIDIVTEQHEEIERLKNWRSEVVDPLSNIYAKELDELKAIYKEHTHVDMGTMDDTSSPTVAPKSDSECEPYDNGCDHEPMKKGVYDFDPLNRLFNEGYEATLKRKPDSGERVHEWVEETTNTSIWDMHVTREEGSMNFKKYDYDWNNSRLYSCGCGIYKIEPKGKE